MEKTGIWSQESGVNYTLTATEVDFDVDDDDNDDEKGLGSKILGSRFFPTMTRRC